MTLTDDQIHVFDRDGVICLRQAVSREWLGRIEAAIERDIATPGPFFHGYKSEGSSAQFHGNMRLWENDPDFADYCLHSPLPGLAARLMRSRKVNLFYDQLFVKEPGSVSPTRWHNDQPYWPIRGRQVMSFWLAVDLVDNTSGALSFIRGSHDWGRWFQPEPFAPGAASYERNPDYEPIPDFDAEIENLDLLTWEMQPGDILAFYGLAVHGGGPNAHANRRRRGYTVRYCGDDARYLKAPGVNAGLCNPDLSNGDKLDSAQYPIVWRNGPA